MAANLDQVLSSMGTAAAPPMRGALAEQLRAGRKPPSSFRAHIALAVAVVMSSVGAAVAVMLGTGVASGHRLLERAPLFVVLTLVCGACAYAALAPRARWRLALGATAIGLGVAALLLGRGAGVPSQIAGWVCTASHFALSGGPLIALTFMLRRGAVSAARGAMAGAAAGTAGAMLGEIACEQSLLHALQYHVLAWALAVAAAVVISRRLKPSSYAP